MVSLIAPDRYAGTGFASKDTSPEIGAMIFAAMMQKSPEARLLIGFDMTARELVWISLGTQGTDAETRARIDEHVHCVARP